MWATVEDNKPAHLGTLLKQQKSLTYLKKMLGANKYEWRYLVKVMVFPVIDFSTFSIVGFIIATFHTTQLQHFTNKRKQTKRNCFKLTTEGKPINVLF